MKLTWLLITGADEHILDGKNPNWIKLNTIDKWKNQTLILHIICHKKAVVATKCRQLNGIHF